MREKYLIVNGWGGGLRGIPSIMFWRRLIKVFPGLWDRVDLFGGVSVGALIFGGIARGLGPETIFELIHDKAEGIFKKTFWSRIRSLDGWIAPEYNVENMFFAIRDAVGDRTELQDVKKSLVVTTFDMARFKMKFYENLTGTDDHVFLSRALTQSAAAPIKFGTWWGGYDGGVFGKNSALWTLAQALDPRNLGILGNNQNGPRPKIEDCWVLDFGTGNPPPKDPEHGREWNYGKAQFAANLIPGIFLDGLHGAIEFSLKTILGERYHLVNFDMERNIEMDDLDARPELVKIGQKTFLGDTERWLLQFDLAVRLEPENIKTS